MFERLNELIPRDNVQDQGEIVATGKNVDFYYSKIFYEMNLKDKLFNLAEIKDRIVEIGPFQNVFLQECEYMNALITEITRSIFELDQGMKGILTMSETMEQLLAALNQDRIPETWKKLMYPTKRFLPSFLDNLM